MLCRKLWILISWLLKKPADLDLHCFHWFMSGFILVLKEFIHAYCLNTARASLRSLCIICSLIWDKLNFFGHVPYGNLPVPGQV